VNRQIRRLGVAMAVLFLALFVQLNVVQVFRADTYNDHPANTRAVTRDFNRPRRPDRVRRRHRAGPLEEVPGPSSAASGLPRGRAVRPLTGYYSFTAGFSGVEDSYNTELSGRATPDHADLDELSCSPGPDGRRDADHPCERAAGRRGTSSAAGVGRW
jgi:peptidoglycan glycosyltransferase